jgi:ubiquinone/menaquinone biosynthesis C-methylase UbiE
MPPTSVAVRNYWPETRCARAFWGQQELPPYRRLLADTAAWLDPGPGERWLDLGCGSGQLTRAVWEKSGGKVAEIVALDCAATNKDSIAKLYTLAQPTPAPDQLRFITCDFSGGLPHWEDGTFDGAVSGLAIQYAQSYSESRGCWTTEAYDHLLTEVHRVLRPGGRFVFSVNVPEPAWYRVALTALHGFFSSPRPTRYVRNAWRMLRYGAWLKQEARRGRFHYLPREVVLTRLAQAGFSCVESRTTYASQAYLFRCRKE